MVSRRGRWSTFASEEMGTRRETRLQEDTQAWVVQPSIALVPVMLLLALFQKSKVVRSGPVAHNYLLFMSKSRKT